MASGGASTSKDSIGPEGNAQIASRPANPLLI
jgi:hypothetical protein